MTAAPHRRAHAPGRPAGSPRQAWWHWVPWKGLLDLDEGRWDEVRPGSRAAPGNGWRAEDDLSGRHDKPSFSPPYSGAAGNARVPGRSRRTGCGRSVTALTPNVAGR